MKKHQLLLLLFAFLGLSMAQAQNRQVSGTVRDATGSTIPGVTVLVKGTSNGVVTDIQGRYSLTVPAGQQTLVFSFVGMRTKEMTLGASNNLDVILEQDILNIEGVVVTAIGIKRETKALGYSVQEVGGSEIAKSNNTNLINSISGRVAGVQINNSSGVAGGSSFITIRGRNSISGENQPLFIVDGVPIDNSQYYSGNPDNLNNNLGNGVAYSNRAIDLNPDDIQNISVLKGGAATALYGLRAANGVVLITTKKGAPAEGGARFNIGFSTSVQFDQINKLPELQDKYSQGWNGNWLGPESGNRYSWGALIDTMRYTNQGLDPDQDWLGTGVYAWDKNGILVGMHDPRAGATVTPYNRTDKFFQTGATYNNSLSLAGGNTNTTYYFSLSNMTSTGVIPRNNFTKTTFKLSAESRISNKVTASGTINYINSGGNRLQQGSNISGVMLGLLRTPCTFDNSNGFDNPASNSEAYLFPDGSQRSYRGFGIYDNPYFTVNNNKFRDDVNRMIGNFQMTYLPTSWMTVTYRIGTDWYADKRKGYYAIGSGEFTGGQITLDNHYSMDINSDLIINMKQDLTKDIKVNLSVGHNMFQKKHLQVFMEGDNLNQPDFYNLSNASAVIGREILDRKRTAAFYGDLGLSYQSLIFLDLTGRNEWSTTLPDNKNSFFFPSASLGFVFTELGKLKDNKVLPFGKLRVSYSIVANDALNYGTIPRYYSSATSSDGWTSGISFPFHGLTGYSVDDGLGNTRLKPERMKSFEIGADLRFVENRINLDFSYYKNRNEDLILWVPVAGSTGYTSQMLNAATMENKGVEILLKGSPVKTKNFEWEVAFNYTRNKNMVVDLAEGIENVNLGGFTGSDIRAVKGMPYATIFGTRWVRDPNGNLVINDDPTDPGYGYPMQDLEEGPIGQTQPDWLLGITNSFRYKALSLSFLIDIKHGGQLYNGTKGALYSIGTHKDTENRGSSIVFEGVKGHFDSGGNLVTDGNNDIVSVKDQNWYTGLGGGFGGPTEQFIEDADWVRLRELTITYSLPSGFVKKMGLHSFDVYFTGKNLWLDTPYSGIDPETSLFGADNAQGIDYFNMPNTRSYLVGLKVML